MLKRVYKWVLCVLPLPFMWYQFSYLFTNNALCYGTSSPEIPEYRVSLQWFIIAFYIIYHILSAYTVYTLVKSTLAERRMATKPTNDPTQSNLSISIALAVFIAIVPLMWYQLYWVFECLSVEYMYISASYPITTCWFVFTVYLILQIIIAYKFSLAVRDLSKRISARKAKIKM